MLARRWYSDAERARGEGIVVVVAGEVSGDEVDELLSAANLSVHLWNSSAGRCNPNPVTFKNARSLALISRTSSPLILAQARFE